MPGVFLKLPIIATFLTGAVAPPSLTGLLPPPKLALPNCCGAFSSGQAACSSVTPRSCIHYEAAADSFSSYTIKVAVTDQGGATMSNLSSALQDLRAERSRTQLQVEKLDQAISVIESLNGSGRSRNAPQPKRIISAASRRKMAQAQKARWANVRKESKPAATSKTGSSPVRHTMSATSRRKIAAAQRARWAKIRAEQKKAV